MSIVEFEMIQSSLFAEDINNNEAFLTSAANWQSSSTKNNSTKVVEVKLVHRAINIYFNIKVRPWQMNVILNIRKYKKDFYTIAKRTANKTLMY